MPERLPRPLLRGVRGAVACGHPLAAAAGVRALASGGTAADAAVAAGMALSVLLPDACGLGGDALALLRTPDDRRLAFNGSGESPAEMAGPVPDDGGGTVTAPGAVAALWDLHAHAGRLAWDQALAPAIELADRGMPLTEDLSDVLGRHRPRLGLRCAGWPILEPSLGPGALVRQAALAQSLTAIASAGPEAFYTGALAEATARAVTADGGWLSVEDLGRHHTVIAPPITADRFGMRISVQPPMSQAVLLLTALGALEGLGPLSVTERGHALVEALEEAFLHRDAIADPVAAAELPDHPLRLGGLHVARPQGPRMAAHTTAVAAADGDGTVVSMLLSVFADFGSALLVAEGGFLLNDRAHGFTQGPNRPAPGARPVHTLSPAMAEDGNRVFALCTPGADGQVQTLAQILTAIAVDGMPIPVALDRPRFRCGVGRLAIESDMDPVQQAQLRSRGHDVVAHRPGDPLFGVAACAGIELSTGTVFAASDPRRESWAAVL